jgi:hypothetical protein
MVPAPPSGFVNQTYPYPQQPQMPDNITYDDQDSYSSPSESNSAWGYAPSGTPLDRSHNFNHPHPSLSSYNRNGIRNGIPAAAPGEPWQAQSSYRTDSDPAANYRNWPATEPSYPVIVNSQTGVYAAQEVDPSMRHSEHATQQSETTNWPQQVASDPSPRFVQEPFQGTGSSYDHPQAYGAPSQPPYYQGTYTQSSSSSPSASHPPLPRHSYTRTLVGPLSSNACRLLDEHRQSGIFFLFQDLSVRTEGMSFITAEVILLSDALRHLRNLPAAFTSNERWRVRMWCYAWEITTTVDIPFPDCQHRKRVQSEFILMFLRSLRKHSPNPSSFSQPSASQECPVSFRFPGLLDTEKDYNLLLRADTTALSIAFGNQGQKLPLVRSFHAPSGPGADELATIVAKSPRN